MLKMRRLFVLLLLILFMLFFGIHLGTKEAKAISWEAAIKAVQDREASYYERANELRKKDPASLGSIFGTYRMREHRCSILGRMVGKKAAIVHLETSDEPEAETTYDYLVAAQSLTNWLHAIDSLKDLHKTRKVRLWNSECVGQMGISYAFLVDDLEPDAFFDIIQIGYSKEEVLHILGPVTEGYHDSLLAALDANPNVTTVALGSSGGNVIEAINAGIEIRSRGLETVLWGDCFSACPLVFWGGTRRTIWDPPQQLGMHQIYTGRGKSIPLDHDLYKLVAIYAKSMGVNAQKALSYMYSAPPEDMFIPTSQQLCDASMATWIQRSCSAPNH
ncbi:hypothetical protein E1162_06230 [Rhodobacteraceae bacterium RKSG542]|uniref:hypothetical protein n=1 Tax=Pseudovibrio flavus TaxID=2529854 RepID=UPI0012BCE5A3|nr:hypothetical protein [Pseudovibrio flavus]MTI16831.1 hypothetical protein [Pseudovibrio flavus]